MSQPDSHPLSKEALAEFRADVASWLESNCPLSQRQPIVREEQIWGGRRRVFPSRDAQQWFEACRDRGFTAPEWPPEYGGAGLNAEQAKALKQEMIRLGCRPPLYCQGLWMLGPRTSGLRKRSPEAGASDRHLSWRNSLGTRLL